jgi:hypothetical protein
MAITAVIKRPNLIIANTTPLTTTQSNPAIELKNNSSGVSQNYLSHLLDVTVDHPTDGQVLTYNANTGKYDLSTINIGEASLDGGNF